MCCCCCYKMLWRAVNMSVVSDDDIFCEYQSVVLLLLCSLRRASLWACCGSVLSLGIMYHPVKYSCTVAITVYVYMCSFPCLTAPECVCALRLFLYWNDIPIHPCVCLPKEMETETSRSSGSGRAPSCQRLSYLFLFSLSFSLTFLYPFGICICIAVAASSLPDIGSKGCS